MASRQAQRNTRKIGRQDLVLKNESEQAFIPLRILTDYWQKRGHKVSRKNDHNFLLVKAHAYNASKNPRP
jgi:hypothetical protein